MDAGGHGPADFTVGHDHRNGWMQVDIVLQNLQWDMVTGMGGCTKQSSANFTVGHGHRNGWRQEDIVLRIFQWDMVTEIGECRRTESSTFYSESWSQEWVNAGGHSPADFTVGQVTVMGGCRRT